MLKVISVVIPLLIALYTILYGWDHLKTKKYSAFIALSVLGLTIAGLPIYILYFKG